MLKIILLAALVALPAVAQNPQPHTLRTIECKLPDCIMVDGRDFAKLMQANAQLAQEVVDAQARAARAERERDEALTARKCGVLEVLPKGRNTSWSVQ